MSWIFGALCESLTPDIIRRLALHHPSSCTTITTANLYIAFGGIPETHWFDISKRSEEGVEGGWLVCGTGLVLDNGRCRFLGSADWSAWLSRPHPDPQALDGHCVALRWSGRTCECFTDRLGMRTLYLTRDPEGIRFSTRLDWLARSIGGCEIDLEGAGAHWLLYNQLVPASMVRNIEKIGPGGEAYCTPEEIRLVDVPWEHDEEPIGDDDCIDTLQAFLHPVLPHGRSLSLGLSGGIDSRVLFALLTHHGHPFFSYVVGCDDDPDVRVSKAIAAYEGIEQIHLDESFPDPEILLTMLADYAGETCAIEPAYTIAREYHHSRLHARGFILVDGGLGEIGRRQYMKRLVSGGGSAMRSGRPEEIMPFLALHRAGVFETGAERMMRRGALNEIESVWRRMPPVDTIGRESFADLLTIRTRFPNYGGRGQSRSDATVVSYMPFVQPTALSALMRLAPSRRRNARLFQAIIRRHSRALAKFPVVKGGTTYPLSLPPAAAWAYLKVKGKLGKRWSNQDPILLLEALSGYVHDLVESREVREYAPYDYPRLKGMVDRFYAGDRREAPALNWWLAFESWRRSLRQGRMMNAGT